MSKINLAKPKRSSGGMGAGGVIALVVVVAILVGAAVFFIPRLTHTCDHCGEFFFGTGYRANIISNILTDIAGKKDKVLCVDCAVKEHALAIATGASVSDFQIPLFDFLENEPEATEGE